MQRSTVVIAIALVIFSLSAASMRAQTIAQDNFAVLGATTVTNTGPTVLDGNLGVSPGTSITGFPPGFVNGTTDIGTTYIPNAAAVQGQIDALAAYNSLAVLPVPATGILTDKDLGGLTLTPGVYFYSSSAQLTGQLTLNFEEKSNQNIVFQIGTALTTASGSSVIIEGAGTGDNVYWDVGTSATLGTTTAFVGDIIAQQSITLNTGATINCGSALALNGAVTMDDNKVSTCTAGAVGAGGGVTNTPEGGAVLLYLVLAGASCFGAMFFISRNRFGICASA
jgi:hypothetical protein